jgi:Cytochrome C and Quinol oxidase polypeptide I
LVDNTPTANVILWSVVSLIALLGGIGLLFGAFGRWNFLGWRGREQATLSFRTPGDVALTPAQRATAWFFLVMAALFLIQALVGAASQHYRADLGDFFGIDLAQVFPYNLTRTFHVQLAIFFVSSSYLAAGIFLAPMIARREPRGQGKLAYILLAAVALVVFGSLIGEFAGVHGWLGGLGGLVGDQGFEYLDLGRLWQVLLVIGLFFWVAILWRGLRGRLSREHVGDMPWLFGRHAHTRSERFRTQAFEYRRELDLWVCPEGEQLRPFAIDHGRRLARYRARPAVCNACPAKDGCTDSEEGREISRPLDPWPHSEAGRFHRGISVVLLALASVIASVGILLAPSLPDLVPPGATLVVSIVVGLRMSRAFAAMPSGFPEGSGGVPHTPSSAS